MSATISKTCSGAAPTTDRDDRHDPRGRRDYLSIQHVARYRFARQRLRPGMRVLDVACGTAYGTQMLSDHGCEMIGGDVDGWQAARMQRIVPQARFAGADARYLPFADESFDAVVSFETIEHVAEGRLFLDEMHRVLKPGGIFICSTPNIAYTAHPAFHVKEYEPGEFFGLVEERFGPTEWLGQYFKLRDRMIDKLMFLKRPQQPAFLPPYFALKVLGKVLQFANKHIMGLLRGVSITQSGQQTGNGPYSVTDYRGDRLLRIMVTVSVK